MHKNKNTQKEIHPIVNSNLQCPDQKEKTLAPRQKTEINCWSIIYRIWIHKRYNLRTHNGVKEFLEEHLLLLYEIWNLTTHSKLISTHCGANHMVYFILNNKKGCIKVQTSNWLSDGNDHILLGAYEVNFFSSWLKRKACSNYF